MVLYPPKTNLLCSSLNWHPAFLLAMDAREYNGHPRGMCLWYNIIEALRQLTRLVTNRFYLFLRDLLALVNLLKCRLRLFIKDARYVGRQASRCFAGPLVFVQYASHQAMRIGFFGKVHHISIHSS